MGKSDFAKPRWCQAWWKGVGKSNAVCCGHWMGVDVCLENYDVYFKTLFRVRNSLVYHMESISFHRITGILIGRFVIFSVIIKYGKWFTSLIFKHKMDILVLLVMQLYDPFVHVLHWNNIVKKVYKGFGTLWNRELRETGRIFQSKCRFFMLLFYMT